jgi:hypothetical protein
LWHRYSVKFRSNNFNLTNRNPWFSSFLVSRVCIQSTTGATSRAGMFCRSLFVLLSFLVLAIVLSVLWFMDYVYHNPVKKKIHTTGLTQPHICACLKPRPVFPTLYIVFFQLFNYLRWLFVLLIAFSTKSTNKIVWLCL